MFFFCGFFDFVVCDSAIQSEVRQFPRMNVVRKKAARVKLDSGSNPIQSILRIDSARQLSIELVFLHHLEKKKKKNQSFQTSWSLPTPFLGLCLPFPNLVVFAYPSLTPACPTLSWPKPRGLCLPFPGSNLCYRYLCPLETVFTPPLRKKIELRSIVCFVDGFDRYHRW